MATSWSRVRNEVGKMRIFIFILCVWFCKSARAQPHCSPPDLESGFLVPEQDRYEDQTEVFYGCDKGLKPPLETWWGVITCNNGQWSNSPQCIDKNHCIAPHVPHATPDSRLTITYSTGQRVYFRCENGYEFPQKDYAECKNGQWILPVCQRNRYSCDPPTRVANAAIKQPYRDTFGPGESVEYVCKTGYELEGERLSSCQNGEWRPVPKCIDAARENPVEERPVPSLPSPDEQPAGEPSNREPVTITHVRNCGTYPTIENGDVEEVENGRALQVTCALLHKLQGPNKIYCEGKKWSESPVCKVPCLLDPALVNRQKYVEHGRHTFYCRSWWPGELVVMCNNGVALYKGCGTTDW